MGPISGEPKQTRDPGRAPPSAYDLCADAVTPMGESWLSRNSHPLD